MMNMNNRNNFLILLLVGMVSLFNNVVAQNYRSGDLIFVSSENSEFEKAIATSTKTENNTLNPNFFETPDMTFKKEGTDEILPYWLDYFEKRNLPVPEGKPGINPTGLSRSEKLIMNN